LLDKDMGRNSRTQYKFGPYTLEPDERRISGEGCPRIELTAKAFDLLVLLVSKAEQLVTKDDILDAVWQEVNIAESNVTATISMIRKALREDSEHQYIETVPKKGYRFVAPVSVVVDPAPGKADPADQALASPVPHGRRFWLLFACLLIVLIATGIGFGILHYRHATANAPETPYQRAVQLETEGNDNLALIKLNDLPPSDPKFAEAKLKAAWLLYQAEENEKANQTLSLIANGKSSLGSGPQDEATRLKIEGLKKLLADEIPDALNDFRTAADTDPADVDALIYIADTAINDDILGVANEALERCKVIASQNPFCGYERIDALSHENKFDEAITEYKRLRKYSNNPWLDQPAGYAELAKGNILEAQKYFSILTAKGRDESPVHFMAAQDGIAAADLLQGKLRLAHSELLAANVQSSSSYEKADYLILLAEIYALQGDSGQTKKELERASKLSDAPDLTIRIAKAYAIIGDHATAQSFLARQLKAAPGLGKDYAAAEPFIDGIESLRREDFQKAVERLASSFSKERSPETAYFLAKAEMGKGDWDAAIGHLNFIGENKVMVLIDSVASLIPLAEYELSKCYRSKGKESEARQHIMSAQAMWKDADPELKAQFKGW
jgi:DNA-binding winged helix-turn-helix (wHTH) protein/tetratricopeptide (TPR) repeat protein